MAHAEIDKEQTRCPVCDAQDAEFLYYGREHEYTTTTTDAFDTVTLEITLEFFDFSKDPLVDPPDASAMTIASATKIAQP